MKKGERHREFDVGARVVVNKKALGGYEARLGTVLEIVLDSRYGVRFDNQQEPIVYLNSEWLDPANALSKGAFSNRWRTGRIADCSPEPSKLSANVSASWRAARLRTICSAILRRFSTSATRSVMATAQSSPIVSGCTR